MKSHLFKAFLCCIALGLLAVGVAEPEKITDSESLRKKAQKTMNEGNWKDAYDMFEKLAMDAKTDPAKAGQDMNNALNCLRNINRTKEIDSFIEKAIKVHSSEWQFLHSAANSYFHASYHHGTIIAGEFERGYHRGGGRYVNSYERDRVRAMQLMEQALITAREKEKKLHPGFYLDFARMLMGYRGYHQAWRLQYLSDLKELPDYDDGYRGYHYGGGTKGAPVDADGKPVFHHVPKSYKDAKTDGERWRWLLNQAMTVDNNYRTQVMRDFATFLHQQFGVQTMASYGWYFNREQQSEEGDESGTYALHTLKETETIAKLATGIKRFELPDEFNYIKIFQQINENNRLGNIFENRRQYDTAVSYWKKTGNTHRINQITGNWGRFEPIMTHPAGEKASVEFRFRNGKEVSFTAHKIDVPTLLTDVKKYLKSNPRQLSWDKMNIQNIGYRLVHKNDTKYIIDKAASWDLKLKPRPLHFDKRITVTTPLKKAGAYLLTAKMKDGNTSKIIIWINDTVIVRKPLNNSLYYFVADAVTGKPLSGINLEFFGYDQEHTKFKKAIGRHYNVVTTEFTQKTDENGQVLPDPKEHGNKYQWLVTAKDDKGRLAYLGFQNVWHSNWYDREYNQRKVFTITDRPVYRPNQPVKFKFWVRHAQYDQEDVSQFANAHFTVRINNPKGEKVFEQNMKADEYGGFNGEYMLPDEAALGMYSIHVVNYGGGSFRVEEYKKPEFEVKVDAPDEPIMLGEKISATITAKYYFGAPVTKAKIKYKVLRSNHDANWYPVSTWDWFYGSGYWWFAYDYDWYPGWRHWGCKRPHWWWWPRQNTPPEIVAEGETKIGEDGTFKVDIDTAIAKELHGDKDHKYEITAEVTDESRRTIVGKGKVLVARKPFKVYAWVNRGHYRVGDVIEANFRAQTLDTKPVKGKGELNLYKISYKDNMPVEHSVQKWALDTNDRGTAELQMKASEAGQYRLSYKVTDKKGHAIEGGYVFCVMGKGYDGKDYRFNELELVPDKKEYSNGDKVQLMVNTDRRKGTVVLFLRPANGIYLEPKVIKLTGKSVIEEIDITKKDMPNFFVEAFTVSGGKIYMETREIIVPPEKRVINVDVVSATDTYKPGEKAKITVKLTDLFGKPFVGSTVMSVYDKSVEYISGGSNVPEIKEFFWKWRRHHRSVTLSSLDRYFNNIILPGKNGMNNIGVFGHSVADQSSLTPGGLKGGFAERAGGGLGREIRAKKSVSVLSSKMEMDCAPMANASVMKESMNDISEDKSADRGESGGGEEETVEPTVRKNFADTAYWNASLMTDKNGIAEVEFDMPENLTGWKIRTWAMGHGTKVGQGEAEVVTKKNLMLRLQAPRFFVQKDEVVLSANIHNYLKSDKKVKAVLELDGKCLEIMGDAEQAIKVKANGEERVDWRVKVTREGEAVVRMKALTDEESDAMEMKFPVYVHGMLKTDSFSGVVRPNKDSSSIEIDVPKERRIDESRLEVRYSPTLAGAMVDALPYLAEYPYGCTEETLNKFLPTVITQKILRDMGIDLKDVENKITNLNAQEIGDDVKRMKDWKRLCGTKRWNGKDWVDRNPVFNEKEVNRMVRKGLKRLYSMQISDGGWGWFSGWGEYSYPHTTAYVVHGLQIASNNGVKVTPDVLQRGVKWLERYQAKQVRMLKNAPKRKHPYKLYADNLDAFIYMVLTDADSRNEDMNKFLYRDRTHLAVYAKSMYGLALHKQKQIEKRDMLIRNIEQYLVTDNENQTAYLNLQNGGYWWYWYGSEYEAQAYYLKLLAATAPKSEKAAGLVKYLLNNRRHATYWNSTRDTAICIEALADYLRASGEDKPDMTVEVYVDGKKMKEVKITADNLFTFDNKFVMFGDAVESGKHKVEIRRKGKGPVYFNAYLTNFTLEDFITKAGLEIKVQRKFYKLIQVDKSIKVAGAHGQALDQKVEKYKREPITNMQELKSGDLVEIELEIESKNDYEYIVFEDMKAAGFEPVDVRSGYGGNDMGAYMELRDERVAFFVRALARGKHSLAYKMRAEIPGKFSALPTKAHAMYAPELKANSDEIKLIIKD